MNKAFLLVGLCMVLCINPIYAQEETLSDIEMKSSSVVKEDFSPQLIEKIKIERNSIYNSLNLTPDQIKKKDEIEQKRYDELQPKLRQLCLDRKNLKNTETKKSDDKTLKIAQNKLRQTRIEIKKISNKYDHEFKKILNSEQTAKYNMIVKLKRADLKALEHKQKETALKPFGQAITQAEYTQKQKEKHSLKNFFKRNKTN